MPLVTSYDVYIFDCDGVILDSNELKLDAMASTLTGLGFEKSEIEQCISYFNNNFGKSRYHHVEIFVNEILTITNDTQTAMLYESILTGYSAKCKSLYSASDITPFFINFIRSLPGKKYVASGSDQKELREVFAQRDLDNFFEEIYGSPIGKSENVASILDAANTSNALMFGDSISDLEAAMVNKIDFIGYKPYSNVPEKLTKECKNNGSKVIECWKEFL